ncbi:HTH psq-type domain-containing protein [Trichonephila clavipes]|nr:HTH psq-type domain-containing protein [Trichonephila clavipes]
MCIATTLIVSKNCTTTFLIRLWQFQQSCFNLPSATCSTRPKGSKRGIVFIFNIYNKQEVVKGVKGKNTALKFGIPPNSLSTTIKNRDKLQNYDSSNSCSKRLRTCVYEDVDEAM